MRASSNRTYGRAAIFSSIDIVDGLSTPGVQSPGALAVTSADYGYTAYANGLLAVYDTDAGRLKVVSRDENTVGRDAAPQHAAPVPAAAFLMLCWSARRLHAASCPPPPS